MGRSRSPDTGQERRGAGDGLHRPGPDPACVFCGIVAGTEPAEVVHSDELVVAFLDRTPLFAGHTLVVPRAHHVTLADVPSALLGPFFAEVQRASIAVRDGMGAAGTFVAMNNAVSQSVPHLHVHVVPRTRGDGLKGFFWPRRRYSDDAELLDAAARVRAAWPLASPDPGGPPPHPPGTVPPRR